jgi:ribosomal protein S30
MTTVNKTQVVHIASEVLAFLTLTFYVNQKNKVLLKHIDDVSQRLEDTETLVKELNMELKSMREELNAHKIKTLPQVVKPVVKPTVAKSDKFVQPAKQQKVAVPREQVREQPREQVRQQRPDSTSEQRQGSATRSADREEYLNRVEQDTEEYVEDSFLDNELESELEELEKELIDDSDLKKNHTVMDQLD